MALTTKNDGSDYNRKDIANHELYWMSILRSDADIVLMSMVDLVDVGVDPLLMQKPMRTMEGSIFTNSTEQNCDKESERFWNRFHVHLIVNFEI